MPLILSVLPSSVCMLCLHTSLFNSNKKTANFLFCIMDREGEKKSSYNHGKYLGFILNPSEFCACPHCDHLGVRPVADISLAASQKELVWKSRRQPTSYDTHRTHTPRQFKVWSTCSEQSSSLKLLEEKRHMAVSESTPSKSWAWVKYSWKWKYPLWIILGKFSIHLHLVHVHMYVYPRPSHTHSWY